MTVDAEPLVDFPRRLPTYPKAPGRPRVGIVHATSVYADEGAVEWSCSCGQGGEEATRGELFFPVRGSSTREAKEVCRGCVVRGECLEYAVAARERFGIWGGLSERERRRERRALALARSA